MPSRSKKIKIDKICFETEGIIKLNLECINVKGYHSGDFDIVIGFNNPKHYFYARQVACIILSKKAQKIHGRDIKSLVLDPVNLTIYMGDSIVSESLFHDLWASFRQNIEDKYLKIYNHSDGSKYEIEPSDRSELLSLIFCSDDNSISLGSTETSFSGVDYHKGCLEQKDEAPVKEGLQRTDVFSRFSSLSIVDSCRFPMYLLDKGLNLVDFNRSFIDLFRLSSNFFLNRPIWEVIEYSRNLIPEKELGGYFLRSQDIRRRKFEKGYLPESAEEIVFKAGNRYCHSRIHLTELFDKKNRSTGLFLGVIYIEDIHEIELKDRIIRVKGKLVRFIKDHEGDYVI